MTAALPSHQLRAQLPEAYRFLFDPHRYKVTKSGRGAAKSWSFAEALLLLGTGEIEGYARPLRITCGRETQRSIQDSVHALLRDWIERLGMERFYTVLQHSIIGANGTEFGFVGLKQLNIANIKSLEGVDIFWVEEGQNVSKRSWEILIPTIRKEGSEIWVSYNPELETDETHMRFAVHPPPGAKVVTTSWRDNPWFPDVLRIEMEHLKATDEKAYQHVWEGECKSAVEGAIFGEEMMQALAEKRITSVPVDRTRPVETFWDLGFGDKTAIWFAQPVGGWYQCVDYLEDEGQTIEWYLIQLQQRGYVYGTDHLPWDAVNAITHKRLQGDKTRSIEMILRAAGRKVRVTPALLVADQINAARTILAQCRFDDSKCYEGLRALRSYQWGPPTALGVSRRQPLHDWACFHPDVPVLTRYGPCRLADLPFNGEILTPCGWRTYAGPRLTRKDAPLVEVRFSDDSTVKCTPEHLFLTANGWRSAESLQPGTQIQSSLTASRSISMAAFIASGRASGIIREAARNCIETCGGALSAMSLRGVTFTTATGMSGTIRFPTWSAFRLRNTNFSPPRSEAMEKVVQRPETALSNGASHQPESCGRSAKRNGPRVGRNGSVKSAFAKNVAQTILRWLARMAGPNDSAVQFARPLTIAGVKPLAQRADAWCIHVEDGHWFSLANGAVVHNSHGASAFCNLAITMKQPEREKEERQATHRSTTPQTYSPYG